MTLAIIIIALLVLLVIVDGSDAAGSHHGAQPDVHPLKTEERGESATGSPCILNVTSLEREAPGQRRHAWKPARQGQAQTTQR